jgi:hypothetical protein
MAPTAGELAACSWIGGGSQLRTDLDLSDTNATIVRARAYVSGLGSFELFLNGLKVEDHIMDPGEAV